MDCFVVTSLEENQKIDKSNIIFLQIKQISAIIFSGCCLSWAQ